MYKQASRMVLRFNTSTGMLTVEDLWRLPLEKLDAMHKQLVKLTLEDLGESFLHPSAEVDTTHALRLDIVRDVMTVLMHERECVLQDAQNKKYNAKIMEMLDSKEDKELESLSKAELIAKLK